MARFPSEFRSQFDQGMIQVDHLSKRNFKQVWIRFRAFWRHSFASFTHEYTWNLANNNATKRLFDLNSKELDRFSGDTELKLFMQNYRPERSIYVLAPMPRLFYQSGRSWKALPVVPVELGQGGIVEVTGEKGQRVFRFSFPSGEYDQLLGCYAHMRVSNVLVIGEHSDGSGALFERQDSYYIYLKDPSKSDSAVRLANGWKSGATVPPWLAMPSH